MRFNWRLQIFSKCPSLVGDGDRVFFQQLDHQFFFDIDFLSKPFPMPQVNVFMANLSAYSHRHLF